MEADGEMHYLRLIFFVSLGATIITLSILESLYIEKMLVSLEEDLTSFEAMLEKDKENINTFENLQKIEYITTKWHKNATKLKYLVWHTGIKDVEVGMSRIATYTHENDFTEAKVELNNLLDFARHYAEDFKILPENVF